MLVYGDYVTSAIFHQREAARRWGSSLKRQLKESRRRYRSKERTPTWWWGFSWNKATDLKEVRSLPRTLRGRAFANVTKTGANATRCARLADSNEAGSRRRRYACSLKLPACNRQKKRNVWTSERPSTIREFALSSRGLLSHSERLLSV